MRKDDVARLIAGLEEMDQAAFMIDEVDMAHTPPSARGLAMVFQSYALYPHDRQGQSSALRLAAHQRATEISQRVETVAKMLNLDGLLDRKPAELSGGPAAAGGDWARSFANPRRFCSMSLCPISMPLFVPRCGFEIRRLQQELGITAVHVTHDQAEAMTMADQIVVSAMAASSRRVAARDLSPTCQHICGGFHWFASDEFSERAHAAHYQATTIGIRPEHLKPIRTEARKARCTVEHLWATRHPFTLNY